MTSTNTTFYWKHLFNKDHLFVNQYITNHGTVDRINDPSAINGKVNIESINKTNYQNSMTEKFSDENVKPDLTGENCHRCVE